MLMNIIAQHLKETMKSPKFQAELVKKVIGAAAGAAATVIIGTIAAVATSDIRETLDQMKQDLETASVEVIQ